MKKKIILLLILILLFPCIVNAASASTSISGDGSVFIGSNITLTINMNESGSSGIMSVGGNVSYDTSKFDLVEIKNISGCAGEPNGLKVGLLCTSSIKGSKSLFRVILKAKATGSGSIRFNPDQNNIYDSNYQRISTSGSNKNITVKDPPSSNNNLKSLSINPGGINFSAGNTNYTVNVDSNITSVYVSAQAEDGKAQVSGTGNKQLNYGSNKISVNVKAENGNVKNYIINVNRKDDRSGDANLKSINVSNGKLNPGFSASTLTYNMEVPYSVSKLNINAQAADSKSKVSINNPNLVAEKTTKVEIKVTAENGNTRTYTISVKRGKDPNKVLSTNNNLSSITVDQGILSPAFNKDQTNYIVYIPYEIDKVNIAYDVEDKEYGVAKIDGPTSLGVGENLFKITVTAEDESTKVYNVIISRGKNLSGEVSNNTYLKEIKLENGKLTSRFKKDVYLYKYTSKKDFKIEAISEDEDSKVETINMGSMIVIVVTAPSGDKASYVLLPKDFNISLLIGIVMFIIVIIGVVLFIIANKRNKKHAK